MITTIYIAISLCVVLGLFFIRNQSIASVLRVLFITAQTALAIHAFLHLNETELGYFTFDALGVILLLTLSVIAYPALIHSKIYLSKPLAEPRTAAIFNGSIVLLMAAMTLGYLANHSVVTWIFTEVTTLSAAMLIYHHRSKLALEGTWKYVFVCAVSICFVFVGILFISLAQLGAGSSDLSYASLEANKLALDPTWMKLGFVFIFAGYTAKLGLFPMFTAGIDAKDKAPAPAGALLASVLMNLGFAGVFRIYAIISGTPTETWARWTMIVSALVTLFIATAYMIRIRNVKRMLAYSGIEHLSVVVLGLCFGRVGCVAALLHLVMHSLIKSGLFFHFTQLWRTYSSKMLDDMGGYLKLNPFGAIALLLGFVSITAVPPSGLFFSELLVFKAMIAEGSWIVLALTVFMLTVLIWAFARSIFKIIFLPREGGSDAVCQGMPAEANALKISPWESVTQLILFALAAYIGFCQPDFLMNLIGEVAAMI